MESRLYGIAYGCPKIDREKDCPLLDMEHFSYKEKIIWIEELDEEKRDAILKHHANCTLGRDIRTSYRAYL